MRLVLILFTALAVVSTAAAGRAAAAEQVDIPQSDTTLHGILFRPEGAGPFPGVVALHGCESLIDRSGKMAPQFAAWGERLAAAGLAAVFPDSFGSRGLRTQCRVSERKVRSEHERVADANAARRWLQSQSWIIKDRISVLGWANGGRASLWAVRPHALPHDGAPDFRSAVALYPGCRRLGDLAWSARIPTLILIGRADDWTAPVPCEQMVAGARGRSALASLVVYPGAYHEFDRPDYPLRELTGLAYTADGSGRAHVGTNAAARTDALTRVPEWLAR
ncbi:MAG TPA: dienelactone hydrolase family protein [Xanthobacteraceae bacterium]